MYAVQIEIEKGEYTLVRKENPWTYDSEVLLFETRVEAEDELTRWNTGIVVDYERYIRPMTKEERTRSIQRNRTFVSK
jgi:hypothetical protein